jgi:MFS family permease
MFGFGVLPALALGFGIAVLPESPRWLLLHQHKQEALKVLSRIRKTNEITAEVNDILEHAESGRGKLADLFSPVVLRVLFFGVGLAIIQQITGINTVIYYAPTIFQQAGFSVRRRLHHRHRRGGTGERVNDRDFNSSARSGRSPASTVSEPGWDVFVPCGPRSGIRGRRSSIEMDWSA